MQTRQDVLILSAEERSALLAILNRSVIARIEDLNGQSAACKNIPAAASQLAYAKMDANDGDYSLFDNMACQQDLYKVDTKLSAGLNDFLLKLQYEIVQPQPVDGLVLGTFKLSNIRQITFGHVGGFPAPAPAPGTKRLVPTLNIFLPGCDSPVDGLSSSCTNAAVLSYNDGISKEDCTRTLSSREWASLKADLLAAYLGVDTSNVYGADMGDSYLTLVPRVAAPSVSYYFLGGEHSHTGKVIIGDALLSQLRSWNTCAK
jgi:hypothetical protein